MDFVCITAVFPSRDDEPLPEGIELVGSSLTIQGPVVHQHAGLYDCVTSYHRYKATLQFNITVKPQVLEPSRCNSLQVFFKDECTLNFLHFLNMKY